MSAKAWSASTCVIASTLAYFLFPTCVAHAQAGPDLGVIGQIPTTFVNVARQWEAPLQAIATNLFDALVVIEIVWSVGWAIAGGIEIPGLLAMLARQLVVIGFFYYLLMGGAGFPNAIIDSFSQAAGQASQASIGISVVRPEDIFSAALTIAASILKGTTWHNISLSICLYLSSIIVIFAFVKVIAILVEVIVEVAFVAYAGVILLGFGGTSFTREYTISYMRYAISVGVKKMFLLLIIAIGTGVIMQVAQTMPQITILNWEPLLLVIAVPILFWQIAERIPYKIQDIITGTTSHGPGTALDKAGAIGRAAAAAAVAAAGGVTAAGAAYNLAQQQLSEGNNGGNKDGPSAGGGKTDGGSGPDGGGSPGFRAVAAQAARNMGGAAANDIGMRLTGDHMTRLLNSGWRMAKGMNQEADANNNGGNT